MVSPDPSSICRSSSSLGGEDLVSAKTHSATSLNNTSKEDLDIDPSHQRSMSLANAKRQPSNQSNPSPSPSPAPATSGISSKTPTPGRAQPNPGIQILLEAEKKAADLVASARQCK